MKRSRALLPTNFANVIAAWFVESARDLPWRKTNDPYKIWISEVMLQQTTVATVVDYYKRFVARFPTIQLLACAHQDEVLKLWEGLGYYRRARHLHQAAGIVCQKFGGRIPDTRDEILTLPGIGAYSAGSILSIAFRKPEAALDGNLIRVYARLLSIRKPVDDPRVLKHLWAIARAQVPTDSTIAREFTEGMMELGALICRPVDPLCTACPARTFCQANAKSLQKRIPRKQHRMRRKKLRETVFLMEHRRRIGVLCRGSDPKFPMFRRLPFCPLLPNAKEPTSVAFKTKYSVTDRDFEVFVVRAAPQSFGDKIEWLTLKQVERELFPAVDRRIFSKLDQLGFCKLQKKSKSIRGSRRE